MKVSSQWGYIFKIGGKSSIASHFQNFRSTRYFSCQTCPANRRIEYGIGRNEVSRHVQAIQFNDLFNAR